MIEEKALPEGWCWATIEQLSTKVVDGTHHTPTYVESGVPFISVRDIRDNNISFEDCKYITEEEHRELYKRCNPEKDDVLLSKVGTIGLTAVIHTDRAFSLFVNTALIKSIREIVSSKYLSFAIRNGFVTNFYNSFINGSNQKFIGIAGIASLPIPLAPLPEQHRIIAAIEQQFSRLDAGVAALQRAKAKLKRYRAAVLKAAVEGKLTKTWRAEHPTTESAPLLLERILKERRAKWEADLRAKGKDPAKVKYNEPAAPNVENLPELPEGWCWASLSQCSRRITDGTHQPPQFIETGVPFIFVAHIVKGSISFENTKYISETTYKQLNTRCPVEYGDILYSAVGSYGVAVPVLTNRPFSFQRHIAHIKPSNLLSMKYLIFCLNSSLCLDQAHRDARGVAQKTVTLTDLARFVIPLAPLAEQEQIVAEVERHLSLINQLEIAVEANLKRAERLRQSIFHEAFAGRLVPQDPTDESASVLLERIQSERNGQKNGAGMNNKKNRSIKVPEPMTLDVVEAEQAELWESVGN